MDSEKDEEMERLVSESTVYMCQLCNIEPDVNDRASMVFNDGKTRAEIRGHKKCIDDLSDRFDKSREEWKQIKKNNKKFLSVVDQFEALDIELEEFLVDF